MPNITINCCAVLNPATLVPTEEDEELLCYVSLVCQICFLPPDLSEVLLQNIDHVLDVHKQVKIK